MPRSAGSSPALEAFDQTPSGPQWIHEIKFDGYRMAARIDQGKVKLLTCRPRLTLAWQ